MKPQHLNDLPRPTTQTRVFNLQLKVKKVSQMDIQLNALHVKAHSIRQGLFLVVNFNSRKI